MRVTERNDAAGHPVIVVELQPWERVLLENVIANGLGDRPGDVGALQPLERSFWRRLHRGLRPRPRGTP